MFGQPSGGGLFGGNTNNNGGGGLFGQANTGFGQPSNNGGGGGLFGGAGNTGNTFGGGAATGGGGLFGGAGNATGGANNMFGGAMNNNNNNNNNNNGGGGLFGGAGNNNGGGMFGQPANNNAGGGMFGGGNNAGGAGMFGQPTQPISQPSQFSLNATGNNNGGGGLFGGAGGAQTQNTGGLFGGAGGFGANNNNGNNMMNNNNNNTNNRAGGGLFGATNNNNTAGGGGIFGAMGGMGNNTSNNNGGGMFGMANNNTNNNTNNAFGNNNAGGAGGMFGGAANNAGGGLFGGANNNNNAGLMGNNANGGLLGGGFSLNNNNGGLLGQNTNNTFGGGLGSFGANNNNTTTFQPKPAQNTSLSKPNEKNVCHSISNGQDHCITEIALLQRNMIKQGQLKVQPNQGGMMFGQNNTLAPKQGGGLFGASTNQQGGFVATNNTGLGFGTQNNTAGGLGGAGMFGATNTQPAAGGGLFGGAPANNATQNGGLFGAKPATNLGGGGGLFGQTQQPATQGGGLFGAGGMNTGLTNTATGGMFGATQNPATGAGGGLFGGAPATGNTGGLFGATNPTGGAATGGLFGGQPAANQGGLFLNTQSNNTAGGNGGLFGAGNATQGGGGLFGGAATTQPLGGVATGGLFGGATNQPAAGGLLGTAPATGGLFGGGATGGQQGGLFGAGGANTAQSGGMFGQAANATQGGGLFGATNQVAAAPMGGANQLGFQNLIQMLEQSNQENRAKSILDNDIEQNWIYGKSREATQPGSLGYYQTGETDKIGSQSYSVSDHQNLYGYRKKKDAFSQFKNHALRGEKDKKDEMNKMIQTFSTKLGVNSESKMFDTRFSTSQFTRSQAAPSDQGLNRTSSSNSQSQNLKFSQQSQIIDRMDICVYYIKSGSDCRTRIPIKFRSTFGDLKQKILDEHYNEVTDVDVRSFRLQVRVKDPKQGPKVIPANNEKLLIVDNDYINFDQIDYIELIERSINSQSLNGTINNYNNSLILNNNLLQNDDNNQRNQILTRQPEADTFNRKSITNRVTIPEGFRCYPTVEELQNFTGDIKSVENFVIENEYVKVVFTTPVDLEDLDLTNIVFEETSISFQEVPSKDKLNKPCVIQFKKLGRKQLDANKTPDQVRALVNKLVEKKNLQLVKEYDVENTTLIYTQESFF